MHSGVTSSRQLGSIARASIIVHDANGSNLVSLVSSALQLDRFADNPGGNLPQHRRIAEGNFKKIRNKETIGQLPRQRAYATVPPEIPNLLGKKSQTIASKRGRFLVYTQLRYIY